MEQKHKISVVMAAYNGGKYIREQLDSILSQTRLPDEIIVSDAGSTDNTLQILSEYARIYPSIKLYNYFGGGATNNFKFAFQQATGDWIVPCDQDDIWVPTKLACLEQNMTDDVDIVYAQDYIFANEDVDNKQEDVWYIPTMERAIWRNGMKGHTCVFRRSLLSLYEHSGEVNFDYVLSLYACLSLRCRGIGDFLVYWRRHKDAVTGASSVSLWGDKPIEPIETQRSKSSMAMCKECFSLLWHAKNQSQGFAAYHLNKVKYIDFLLTHKEYVNIPFEMAICYRNCLYYATYQTVWTMFKSCWYSAKGIKHTADFKRGSLRHKLGKMKWAFCLPAVIWTQTHNYTSF